MSSAKQVSERTIEEVSAELPRIDPPAFPAVERIHVADEPEVVAVVCPKESNNAP